MIMRKSYLIGDVISEQGDNRQSALASIRVEMS